MAIPIEHEDVEELKKWGMGLEKLMERCTLCDTPTRYWHDATNTPVCEGCAATHKVSDLVRSNAEISSALAHRMDCPVIGLEQN